MYSIGHYPTLFISELWACTWVNFAPKISRSLHTTACYNSSAATAIGIGMRREKLKREGEERGIWEKEKKSAKMKYKVLFPFSTESLPISGNVRKRE